MDHSQLKMICSLHAKQITAPAPGLQRVGKKIGKPCLAKSLATEGNESDWRQGWEGKL
jgi:hypothetical protein